MTDWAAALTYYGLLSLFPALIALVSIARPVRRSADDDAADHRHRHPDRPELGRRHVLRARSSRSPRTERPPGSCSSSASAIALWSASDYVGAFIRASNIVWETPEGRPFFKLRPLQILVTLVMIVAARARRAGARPHRARSSRRSAARSVSATRR